MTSLKTPWDEVVLYDLLKWIVGPCPTCSKDAQVAPDIVWPELRSISDGFAWVFCPKCGAEAKPNAVTLVRCLDEAGAILMWNHDFWPNTNYDFITLAQRAEESVGTVEVAKHLTDLAQRVVAYECSFSDVLWPGPFGSRVEDYCLTLLRERRGEQSPELKGGQAGFEAAIDQGIEEQNRRIMQGVKPTCSTAGALAEQESWVDLTVEYEYLHKSKLAALGFEEQVWEKAVRDFNSKPRLPVQHVDKVKNPVGLLASLADAATVQEPADMPTVRTNPHGETSSMFTPVATVDEKTIEESLNLDALAQQHGLEGGTLEQFKLLTPENKRAALLNLIQGRTTDAILKELNLTKTPDELHQGLLKFYQYLAAVDQTVTQHLCRQDSPDWAAENWASLGYPPMAFRGTNGQLVMEIRSGGDDVLVLHLPHRGPDDPNPRVQPVLTVKRWGAVEVKPGWRGRLDETAVEFWRAIAHVYQALPLPVSRKQEAIIDFCQKRHMTLAEFDQQYYIKPAVMFDVMGADDQVYLPREGHPEDQAWIICKIKKA